MIYVENGPETANLCDELLDMSNYVLRTCGRLQVAGLTGKSVSWKGQNNPELAVEASLVYPLEDPATLTVAETKMRVEYPDIGLFIFISRGFEKSILDNDDVIGTLVLDTFRKHYQKCRV